MRLQEYWGIGPKTAELLTEELGAERAVAAIESADTRTLTAAGLSRGRATRILRRASGAESMDLLATRDTREVYKELLDLAEEYAVTADAADSIRVLTPLPTRERMEDRLDDVLAARDTWADLSETDRTAVRDAFDEEHAEEETFAGAVRGVAQHLPVSMADLRRKSTMVSGLQANLTDFLGT
jgi:hypothetical protein